MKRAIVLSGGGARGSYQIGVWKALRKLRIKYDIVTGTSVGSLNGALMTQKTYFKGVWFWKNISYKQVFKDEIIISKGKKDNFKKYAKAIIVENGMDVSNLEDTVEKALNEKKLRKSNIDFGLVTFNLTSLKPIRLTKKEIPVGKMKDYLIASATCYPAFKKKSIDNEEFIDGGYSDNLPINLAIKMGAEEIIAVDLRTIGLKRRARNKKVKVTYITPRNSLGSLLSFDKISARRGIRLGYNDTMKISDKLDGNKYTFKKEHLKRNFQQYKDVYKEMLDSVLKGNGKNVIEKLLKITTSSNEISEKRFNKIVEYLGKVFKLDDSNIYNINSFNKKLICELDEMLLVDKKLVEQKIKGNDIKKLINNKFVIKYIYDKLIAYDNKKIARELAGIALLLPREFLGASYLYVVKNN